MNNMELSLVLFTVLSQAAVGLTVMAALRQWNVSPDEGTAVMSREWLIAGVVLAVALVISLFHLGHPLGSPRTIVNLGTSWLSREVLGFGLFGGILAATWALSTKDNHTVGSLGKVTALVGMAALVASGMVYAPPSFPALNNGLPVLFYLLTAVILGAAFSSYFAAAEYQPLLTRILVAGLVVGLVLNLVLPSVWLAGGRVMQMTGDAYYGSGIYWVRIVAEFGVALAVLGIARRIPVWLPVVLLFGELIGRIMVFTHVVHTASNIGGIY